MNRRALLALLLAASTEACAAAGPTSGLDRLGRAPPRADARRRLRGLAREYEQLMKQHGLVTWRGFVGSPPAANRLAELRIQERQVFEEARSLLEYHPQLTSPRQRELWLRGGLGLELTSDPEGLRLADELTAIVSEEELSYQGRRFTPAELGELKSSNKPAERRLSRTIMHQLHKRAKPAAEGLIKRRVELARVHGASNYWDLMLGLRGVDPKSLYGLLGQLGRELRPAFDYLARSLKRGNQRRAVASVDARWALRRVTRSPEKSFDEKKAEATVKRMLSKMGISLEGVAIAMKDMPFGGQSLAIQIPGDVRVVLRPRSGSGLYAVLLHELGHAFAARHVTTRHPIFKGYEWVPGLIEPGFDEGLAEVFSGLLDEPAVLANELGLSAAERSRFISARRLEALSRLQRTTQAIHFEREAYVRPDKELDSLSLRAERRYSRFDIRDAEPIWATSPFLAEYPVYRQSYLIATVMAEQVIATLRERLEGDWLVPETGRLLASELVEDGVRWTLDERLVRFTGEPLSARHLTRRFLPAAKPILSSKRFRRFGTVIRRGPPRIRVPKLRRK